MASNNPTQPIPFPNLNQDEPHSHPPSINNLPSNSQFNFPQLQSAASINYNEDQNPPNQLPSQKQIIQQQQAEELQKVSLQKNSIDQDEILRMFMEEQNKIDKYKKNNQKKKPTQSANSQHHKDKKSTLQPTKKQPSLGQDLNSSKRRQPAQQTLPYLSKPTSFKDIKSQPISASPYFTIFTSQAIRQLLLQYKIQYRTSVYDPDWQKERYKLKEGFYEQLCIGVQEMRQKPQGDLSPQENDVLRKIKEISAEVIRMPYDFGVFKYCRNLVIQIDLELFMHFHQKSKQPLSKDYKSQYKILLNNLKDPQNYELRQKILTKKMDAEMLKVANEFELLTESKRNEIKSKEQKLLKQFSIDHDRHILKPEFQNQKEEQRVIESISYGPQAISDQNYLTEGSQGQIKANESLESLQKQESLQNQSFSISSLLAVNKYLEESTLSQLQELLSDGQMQRMRTRLDEDLKGQCRLRMLRRFDSLVLNKV